MNSRKSIVTSCTLHVSYISKYLIESICYRMMKHNELLCTVVCMIAMTSLAFAWPDLYDNEFKRWAMARRSYVSYKLDVLLALVLAVIVRTL